MSEVLDLSGANLKGFDPIPSGSYPALVFEVEQVETSNPDGNLPVGTPGYNVQFKVDGGEYDNRRVFNRYWIPPSDYDESKRKNMNGMFARFLMAIGYTEKEVTSGKFKFDPEDAIGRECTVVVGVRPADEERGYEAQNNIRNVKPRTAASSEGDDLL
jgi:hypothetical protein